MQNTVKVSDDVLVGPQPTREELRELVGEGIRTVVNFRTPGEEDQPMSPEEEAEVVRELGLNYLHVPVSMKSLSTTTVDNLREEFRGMPGPAFAHCRKGKRAAAMLLMHLATEHGWSGEETIERAESLGFAFDQPKLGQFVVNYVDSHGATKEST